MGWDHPQSAWVCETAELLAGFSAPAGEGTRRLLWAAAGLPHGRPAVDRARTGHRARERAREANAEALAVLGEACAAAARLAEEQPDDAGRAEQVAVDLLEDAETALREALDLVP